MNSSTRASNIQPHWTLICSTCALLPRVVYMRRRRSVFIYSMRLAFAYSIYDCYCLLYWIFRQTCCSIWAWMPINACCPVASHVSPRTANGSIFAVLCAELSSAQLDAQTHKSSITWNPLVFVVLGTLVGRRALKSVGPSPQQKPSRSMISDSLLLAF